MRKDIYVYSYEKVGMNKGDEILERYFMESEAMYNVKRESGKSLFSCYEMADLSKDYKIIYTRIVPSGSNTEGMHRRRRFGQGDAPKRAPISVHRHSHCMHACRQAGRPPRVYASGAL